MAAFCYGNETCCSFVQWMQCCLKYKLERLTQVLSLKRILEKISVFASMSKVGLGPDYPGHTNEKTKKKCNTRTTLNKILILQAWIYVFCSWYSDRYYGYASSQKNPRRRKEHIPRKRHHEHMRKWLLLSNNQYLKGLFFQEDNNHLNNFDNHTSFSHSKRWARISNSSIKWENLSHRLSKQFFKEAPPSLLSDWFVRAFPKGTEPICIEPKDFK